MWLCNTGNMRLMEWRVDNKFFVNDYLRRSVMLRCLLLVLYWLSQDTSIALCPCSLECWNDVLLISTASFLMNHLRRHTTALPRILKNVSKFTKNTAILWHNFGHLQVTWNRNYIVIFTVYNLPFATQYSLQDVHKLSGLYGWFKFFKFLCTKISLCHVVLRSILGPPFRRTFVVCTRV